MYEPPRSWRRRNLGGGSVGLLGLASQWMHLIVPPGASFRYDETLDERGYWRHAIWSRAIEPMIGVDEPERVRHLTVVAVSVLLPASQHDFVRSVLADQMRRASLFATPEEGACLDDERARLAGRATSWARAELRAAFPAESWYAELDCPAMQIPWSADELLELLPATAFVAEARAEAEVESQSCSCFCHEESVVLDSSSIRGRMREAVDVVRYALVQQLLPRTERQLLPELREQQLLRSSGGSPHR